MKKQSKTRQAVMMTALSLIYVTYATSLPQTSPWQHILIIVIPVIGSIFSFIVPKASVKYGLIALNLIALIVAITSLFF